MIELVNAVPTWYWVVTVLMLVIMVWAGGFNKNPIFAVVKALLWLVWVIAVILVPAVCFVLAVIMTIITHKGKKK